MTTPRDVAERQNYYITATLWDDGHWSVFQDGDNRSAQEAFDLHLSAQRVVRVIKAKIVQDSLTLSGP